MRNFRYVTLIVCIVMSACAQREAPLHVASVGAGSPPIIVLHGGPGIRHNYLRPEWDNLSDLAKVIYYDQRGCGLSSGQGPHHWRQHVADLHALIQRESPRAPVTLAASSWGSYLALLYAHAHPARVSAVVLSGLSPWPNAEEVRAFFAQLSPEDQAILGTLQATPATSAWTLDSAAVAMSPGFHPTLAPRVGESCTGAGRATYFSLESAPSLTALAKIENPVLIVRGPLADPSIDGAREIGAVLPNAEVISLEGTGHNPWVESTTHFFEIVREFVVRHRVVARERQ
jgi:pimeloyl-ACP methyl ester carboxylesterase